MAIAGVNIGQELLNVPMGEMIRSMAMSIADAQWELDKSSTVVTELMSGQRMLRDLETGEIYSGTTSVAWFDSVSNSYVTRDLRTGAEKHVENDTVNPTIIDSRIEFGYTYVTDSDGKNPKRIPQRVSMMELGFTPTFYQFVDTIIEVKIAIKITQNNENSTNHKRMYTTTDRDYGWRRYYNRGWRSYYGYGNRTTATTSQVDANYANRYSYSVDGASLLRTKLVPTPPPAILEDRIRALMEEEQAYRESLTKPDIDALNAAKEEKDED